MTQVSSSLSDLVQALNDGIDFYMHAAEKTNEKELSEFFQRMSYLKKTIASDLNAEIAIEGDRPTESGSFVGSLRKTYTDLKARLGDATPQYIAELEEHEDRLLAAFREAALQDKSSRVRDLALMYFPEIERMHSDMRRLKQSGTLH